MAIKWKNWTRRLPVKICCTILIPIMAFAFLMSFFGIEQMDIRHRNPNLLFADLSNNDYFFDNNMPGALRSVDIVFSLRSEESIRNMDHLEWVREDSSGNVAITGWYSESHIVFRERDAAYHWYRLRATNPSQLRWDFGSVEISDAEQLLSNRAVQDLMTNAIGHQLREFHSGVIWLEAQGGLYYFATDGTHTLSNLPAELRRADFFQSQPVYFVRGTTGVPQVSTDSARANHLRHDMLSGENFSGYIAFSQEAVDFQTAQLLDAQRQFGMYIAFMIASVVAALVALIILMVGAGKVYGDEGGKIHFTFLDKPWLDLGLGALFIYLIAITHINIGLMGAAWQHNNAFWIIVFFAFLSVFFTLPLTYWILSFTKRCKAGKFWRYTLLYTAGNAVCNFIKASWAGIPLTARVVLIGGILFFSNIFFIVVTNSNSPGSALFLSFLFTGLLVFVMLRHARKIHLLEQGAKAVSSGDYDTFIDVTGGALGSVAASINNISGGINNAVTERMKSERLKTELITNVSHDIRTPLTSLITYTDLLKSEGLNSEKASEYLDILIQKTARLKTLTDDLFEASKAASGNINVNLETLDLADFIRQVLGEMDERVRISGLDFRLNLLDHALVRADGKLLWRVMENLLSNVFKYALADSRVYVDVTHEEQWHRLDIKNISEYALNVEPFELTERFKRGDSARAGEGSGLGLSIAQGFVQSQGGRFAIAIDGDLFKATIHLQKEG